MLVVLILNPTEFDEYAEADMWRWWRQRCRKHTVNGEVYFEVASPVRLNVYEAIKRLASFGVRARAARRPV